jgi:glycosyltransferase involved in cell wall biosynthesis
VESARLVKVGLIARADDRGLGHMTWEFHRHLAPARTLVVREPGAEARGFAPHLDRYPDGLVVRFDGGMLPEAEVRDWLQGLDVLYSAETFYDWHLVQWAAEAGVATVLHLMPEFHHHHVPPTTAVWAPTPWRLQHLPAYTQLVPVPVATDRFPEAAPARAGQLRVLHTAGHRAAADRNGTTQLLQALRRTRQPMTVRLATQDAALPKAQLPANVTLATEVGGTADYWDLYADADVLVLPRRYGGLCLPVQEAMAAGLAVVLPDCSPNDWWPALRVTGSQRGNITTAAGQLPLFAADPRRLAAVLDQLATDEELLEAAQLGARAWASLHSWQALAPVYRTELERAAERC